MSSQDIRAGRAYVNLYMKDSLSSGLKRASARLKSWGSTMAGIGTKMTAIITAMSTPAILAVKTFVSVGDAMNKMSARTGAAVEFLSSVGFAAEQSGADLQTFEKGVIGMQRTMLNAERGLSTAVDSLSELGLTVNQLSGKSPEQQFMLLADAVASVNDPSRRAALAMQVFGKAGQKLIPMMAGGAAGIKALQAEAASLGRTMTTEQAQAAADLTDAWNRVKSAWTGAAQQGGASLAPALLELAETILKYRTELKEVIKISGGVFITTLRVGAFAAQKMISVLKAGRLVVMGFASTLADAARIATLGLSDSINSFADSMWQSLKDATAEYREYNDRVKSASGETSKAAQSMNAMTGAASTMADQLSNASSEVDSYLEHLADLEQRFNDTTLELRLDGVSDKWASVMAHLQLPEVESYRKLWEDANQNGMDSTYILRERIEGLREAFGSGKKAVDAMKSAMEELRTPEDKLTAYHADLQKLVNARVIKPEQAQKLYNKAYQESPRGQAAQKAAEASEQTKQAIEDLRIKAGKLSGRFSELDVAVYDFKQQHQNATPEQITEFRNAQQELLTAQKEKSSRGRLPKISRIATQGELGTFSAFAVAGMSTGTTQDRIAKATEESARILKMMERRRNRNQPVFDAG